MALNTTITASIKTTQTGVNDLGIPYANLDNTLKIALADGSLANQATKTFSDKRTLTASSTENLDMAGSLIDALGATLTFTAIKAILITAASTNTNNVVVGGAATNTQLGIFNDPTDKIVVKPGGCFLWAAPGTGATVTAATGDILLVANSGAGSSVDYNVTIVGI